VLSGQKGTAILLNSNLVVTNKHLLPDQDTKGMIGSIIYAGKEYKISKILNTNGSLDVLFITLKDKVKSLVPLKSEWDFDDLLSNDIYRG